MPIEDDDLRFSTANRFSKRSPRLLLEEHRTGDAESEEVVPGWVRRDAGVPAILHVALPGGCEAFLDGKPLEVERMQVSFGEHVLAFRLTPHPLPVERGVLDVFAPRSVMPFLVALVPDAGESRPVVATADDGQWRSVATEPAEGWPALEFDDGSWSRLRTSLAIAERIPEPFRRHFLRLHHLGATPLELPQEPDVWVRRRFTVERDV